MASFDSEKSRILHLFQNVLSEGRVDQRMVPLLQKVNDLPDAVSLSSCAGRAQLIALPDIGDKAGSQVLGKWHDPFSIDDLQNALALPWTGRYLFLLYNSPLLHIMCRDLRYAERIRTLGMQAGMKYSTIRSLRFRKARVGRDPRDSPALSPGEPPVAPGDHRGRENCCCDDGRERPAENLDKIVVEIQSTERLDALVGWDGAVHLSKEQAASYHTLVLRLFERSMEKLGRLEKAVEGVKG